MLATVLATSAALLATPVTGLLGHRALRRAVSARLLRIDSPNGIDEQGFVRIGGIEQWISIRGEDRANPVVVEIHGGPGASHSIFAERTRSWEAHFTIVRWDMRGAGKTFGRSGPQGQGELSFGRLYEDALEVTRYARERLGADRVVLVASSLGSVFGLRLARSHPELYSAYVGTDQNVLDAGRDTSVHEALLARLRAAGKDEDAAAVLAMGSDPHRLTADQRAAYGKLTVASDPLTLDTLKSVVLRSLWFSPLHSLRELGQYFAGMKFSARFTPELDAFDDRADGTRFELPFFVFQGDQDVITPAERARAFFDEVEAPVKEFALIEDASHFASFRHPDRFLELMLTRVRPVVVAAAGAGAA
ncbi:alpha/beta fold hydrolase [Streptomyces sp. NBC_00272]|uniref:alpha/beta fold hydrolase n=1 Tax=Streptomyces sp. NBC_00272 TaxID=2975698 RepID=UPI002E2DDCB7|nr:alpha/beta hydrolase [Streptomyces sp. NBC_00272]